MICAQENFSRHGDEEGGEGVGGCKQGWIMYRLSLTDIIEAGEKKDMDTFRRRTMRLTRNRSVITDREQESALQAMAITQDFDPM